MTLDFQGGKREHIAALSDRPQVQLCRFPSMDSFLGCPQSNRGAAAFWTDNEEILAKVPEVELMRMGWNVAEMREALADVEKATIDTKRQS